MELKAINSVAGGYKGLVPGIRSMELKASCTSSVYLTLFAYGNPFNGIES